MMNRSSIIAFTKAIERRQTLGQATISYRDYAGESTSARFPGADLTAANIVAQMALITAIQAALEDVLIVEPQQLTVVAKVSPLGVGNSSNPESQRELKALVRYHDSVTMEKGSLELPSPDRAKQSVPDYFYGQGTVHADWTAAVSAMEDYLVGAGGNAVVIDEIVLVGRNL